jgi:predicted TPR repeat methyltransferase
MSPAGIYRRETIRNLLDAAAVHSCSRVLEIGAGTGLVLQALLERTKPVVGTDVSMEMLNRAREALAAEGKRVEIVDALPEAPWAGPADVWLLHDDIRQPSRVAVEFDAILAMEVFRYIEHLDTVFHNVAAMITNETVFAFTSTNIWSASLFPLKFELRRRLGRVDAKTELMQYFITEKRLRKALDRAGLALSDLRRLHCTTFNPLARRLVHTPAGAERLLALDRKLAQVPLANQCFDTLVAVAVKR